ncbi:MAG: hypothetical protein NZM31_07825, partial [Gemmatales bacterium]|nr:hypothetical protein [Gemmatales bacterium]MDW8386903.1 hypothetical protein [Gemmatales bacterium]
MSTSRTLIDSNGTSQHLGDQLASGGEGAVHCISNNPTLVAKIYHQPPFGSLAEKLRLMVTLTTPKLLEFCAWPASLLYEPRTRQLVGFVMPRLHNCQPIQRLFNPAQRFKYFSRAGWDFQIRACLNLAAAFDEVHKSGCVVGDVNESNIQVTPQAIVKLIDCDSFQISYNGRTFPCPVGKPEYTPPELQNKPLSSVIRTVNHDCFGLAVLIYQLLIVGRHPYAGKLPPNLQDHTLGALIARFLFVQGRNAQAYGIAPPPFTPSLNDLPPEFASLFLRAFEPGRPGDERPRPSEWTRALRALEQGLVTCSADAGHKYWGRTSACIWCRLSRDGYDYYYGVAGDSGSFELRRDKLEEILRRISACENFSVTYDRSRFLSQQPIIPRAIPEALGQLRARYEAVRSDMRRKYAELEQARDRLAAANKQQLMAGKTEIEHRLAEKLQSLQADLRAIMDTVTVERYKSRYVNVAIGGICLVGIIALIVSPLNFIIGALGGIMCMLGSALAVLYNYSRLQTPAERRFAEIRNQQRRLQKEAEVQMRVLREQLEGKEQAAAKALREEMQRFEKALEQIRSRFHEIYNEEMRGRQQAYQLAESRIIELEAKYSQIVAQCQAQLQKSALEARQAVDHCHTLESKYNREMMELENTSRHQAFLRHLRLYQIIDAEIPGIGPGRKQALMFHGIVSAADIEEERILAIPGFGERLTSYLLDWREEVIEQFTFDPRRNVALKDRQSINQKYCKLQNDILRNVESR